MRYAFHSLLILQTSGYFSTPSNRSHLLHSNIKLLIRAKRRDRKAHLSLQTARRNSRSFSVPPQGRLLHGENWWNRSFLFSQPEISHCTRIPTDRLRFPNLSSLHYFLLSLSARAQRKSFRMWLGVPGVGGFCFKTQCNTILLLNLYIPYLPFRSQRQMLFRQRFWHADVLMGACSTGSGI